jgi:hypothetical protein
VPPRYEVRVRDRASPSGCLADSFADCEVATAGDVVIVGGEFDQSALHGLLERIRVLRLELLDLRRTRGVPRRPGPR